MHYYHVTPFRNWPSINQYGLIPQIGPNAKALGETKPTVFLFPSKDDMNNALSNWFGDLYNENEDLISIMINCPSKLIHKSTVEYERIAYTTINPKYFVNIEHV